MKQVIITAVVFVSLFAFTAPLVRAADYRVGVTEVHPGEKVFKWSENLEGDCHQLGATLKIRTNGTATFDADTWTRTRGTDVWHSTITLHGAINNKLGESVRFDSPKMPHYADGPKHLYHTHFEFTFPPAQFHDIILAVEHSAC